MSEQIGIKIKEARNNAGMSQEKLAKAAAGVSVSDISKAERGLKELTPEQLGAIAEATGVAPESLTDTAEIVPVEDPSSDTKAAVPVETKEETDSDIQITVTLSAAEKELLDSYKAAPVWKQKIVLYLLKGEKPQMQEIMAMITGMMTKCGAENGSNPLAGIMSSIKGMMDSSKSYTAGGKRKNFGAPGYLLTFTYAYSVTIYIFLLSFYFWLLRTDIKPEKA